MQIDQIITDNILLIFNSLIIAETALAIMAVFILFVFKRNKNANFFLAFFIITYSASFLPYFFYKNDLLIPAFLLSSFTLSANSLIGVFLYFYTSFMTGRVEKLNRKDIVHFLPFIALIILYLSACIVYYVSYIRSYDFSDLHHIPMPEAFLVIAGGAIVNSIIYTVLSYIRIRNYSRAIKNYASDVENIDMRWLNKIIYFSIFATVVFFICFSITIGTLSSVFFISIDTGVFMIMLFILAFYSINQPELINENRELYSMLNNLNLQQNNTPEKRYEKFNLDVPTQEAYLQKLDAYMEQHKPHLNERITIKEVAEELNIPYYHLSMAINNLLNKNFYDFINEYRIREVLNILDTSKHEVVNILAIAFKCGFNSKSTFNRVFKNKTGTTPSQYKNRNK